MSVTSVSAGTGGVTVTGLTTQPVINIPTPVTSVTAGTGSVTVTGPAFQPVVNGPVLTAGTNTTVSGTLMAPQVNVASPLTLAAPLVLSTAPPASSTELGFTVSATNAGSVSFVTNTPITLATATIILPGVYVVNANVPINISTSTALSQCGLLLLMSPNVSIPQIANLIPYGPTTMTATSQMLSALTGVVTVTTPGSCVFTLQGRAIFTGGTGVSVNPSTTVFTITRIA